jgi:cytoplasmic iron level regulating protein YaaA (DUF328/UPF0246 family)
MTSVLDFVSQYSNSVPILLVPPSEGKAEGGTSRRWTPDSGSFGRLTLRREAIVAALRASAGGDQRLLGVKGDHLDRARRANVELDGAPSMPAWERYTGVVWDHLDPNTLPAEARRRLVVVSGLLGLARGDDPVPEYRLKMGVNLAPLGKLSTWWRDDLSDALNHYATGRTSKSSRVLVDLLPQEHRAAWTPDRRVRGLSLELIDPSGKPGGHFAKAAKGELARAILTDGLSAIERWSHDRFQLSVTPVGASSDA